LIFQGYFALPPFLAMQCGRVLCERKYHMLQVFKSVNNLFGIQNNQVICIFKDFHGYTARCERIGKKLKQTKLY